MTLEKALRLHLKATVAGIGTRVYGAGQLFQAASLPAITIQRISSVPFYTHQGRCDTRNSRLQINVHADTLDAAESVTTAVETSMDSFTMSGGGGRARELNRIDLGRDKDSAVFSWSLDYEVIHVG